MNIIDNPSREQLDKMQNQLAIESGLEIVDIWVAFSPVYILALDSGKEIGVMSLSINGKFAEIYKLYIPAKDRRKNYASELFYFTISYLSSKGVTEVGIEAVGDSYLFWNTIISNYKYEKVDDNRVILDISNS